MAFFGFGAKAAPLAPGAEAPALSAIDQDGETVSFAEIYAKGPTLIYFYPKADTPGCTAQACSLRDSFAALQGRGLQILGVSSDKSASQKKFQEKYQLPFTLIADGDGKVAAAFGVSRLLGFASRQSFLVQESHVVWNSLKAKTRDHAREVEAALDSLK